MTSKMTSELSDSSAAFAPLPRFGVSGTITLNGAPLAGVEVTLTGDRKAIATTGADGRYAFASLPMGGGYTVTPELEGYLFAPPSASIASLPADTTADFAASLVTFTRYLSEGAVGPFWETSIALLNGSGTATTGGCRVPAAGWPSRVDHGAAHRAGPCGDRSGDGDGARRQRGVLHCDHGASAARREPHDALGRRGGLGAHAEQAINEPRTLWYFGEGVTGCADLFYLLVNPGATAANVEMTYARRAPGRADRRHYPPGRRVTRARRFTSNAEDGLAAAEVSGADRRRAGSRSSPERSMYSQLLRQHLARRSRRGGRPGAGRARGISPRRDRQLLRSAILLIANFEPPRRNWKSNTCWTTARASSSRTIAEPGSRLTIDVANESPQLANAAISSIVRSTSSVPVVAERAQWWPDGRLV